MAQLHDHSVMSAPDFEALLEKTAEYLGISDDAERSALLRYVSTAAEIVTMQTGETDFDTESAKQAVISKAAILYADRFGEMNNKEGSAMSHMMRGLEFVLRVKNIGRAQNEDSNDAQE